MTNQQKTQDRLNLNIKGGTRQQDTGELNQANQQGDNWEQVRGGDTDNNKGAHGRNKEVQGLDTGRKQRQTGSNIKR